ncbi:hypothetical protein Droror1_Dr00010697 [Drosera rotundifolia]
MGEVFTIFHLVCCIALDMLEFLIAWAQGNGILLSGGWSFAFDCFRVAIFRQERFPSRRNLPKVLRPFFCFSEACIGNKHWWISPHCPLLPYKAGFAKAERLLLTLQ